MGTRKEWKLIEIALAAGNLGSSSTMTTPSRAITNEIWLLNQSLEHYRDSGADIFLKSSQGFAPIEIFDSDSIGFAPIMDSLASFPELFPADSTNEMGLLPADSSESSELDLPVNIPLMKNVGESEYQKQFLSPKLTQAESDSDRNYIVHNLLLKIATNSE